MPPSNLEAGSPIKPNQGEQALVEFLGTIELPPLPSPRAVRILDVLDAVYSDHPVAIEVKKRPEITIDTQLPVVKAVSTNSENSLSKTEIDPGEELSPSLSARVGFKLALFSSISSIVGWIAILLSMDETGGVLFLCCEFLAICFALAGIGRRVDKPETTTLRMIGLAFSIGWLPIIGLVFIGWPLFVIIAIIGVIWFLCSLANEDSRSEVLNIN